MNYKKLDEIIKMNENSTFPNGMCGSGERCSQCRFIDMDNNMYNDGTRHCRERGRWVYPSDPACPRFKW